MMARVSFMRRAEEKPMRKSSLRTSESTERALRSLEERWER